MSDSRQRAAEAAGRLVFPVENACHLCHSALVGSDGGGLCAGCMAGLRLCRISHRELFSVHPPLESCVSAYDHICEARELVHLLKYRADPLAAQALGEGMTDALVLSGLLPMIDIAVPVPVSPSRLRERGYNQAALLAREVCVHTGLTLCEDVLLRLDNASSQVGRSSQERLRSMEGAFEANAVGGRHVLLIDDVLTTGATAVACARALMAAGAGGVWLITACRA